MRVGIKNLLILLLGEVEVAVNLAAGVGRVEDVSWASYAEEVNIFDSSGFQSMSAPVFILNRVHNREIVDTICV